MEILKYLLRFLNLWCGIQSLFILDPQLISSACRLDDLTFANGLIYFINKDDGKERLCIPKELHKEVFQLAHDEQSHGGFYRTYQRLTNSIHKRKMSRRLTKYIQTSSVRTKV